MGASPAPGKGKSNGSSPAPKKEKSIGWSKPATKHRTDVKREIEGNLNTIAECLARHDKAASVAPVHVDRAFETLSAAGMRRRRLVDRPEAEMSLGGFFCGFAFACPDAISVFLSEEAAHFVSSIAFCGFLLLGSWAFIHGYMRSLLPVAPTSGQPWWKTLGLRIAIYLALVLGLSLAAFYIYWRFAGDGCISCKVPPSESSPTLADPDRIPAPPTE